MGALRQTSFCDRQCQARRVTAAAARCSLTLRQLLWISQPCSTGILEQIKQIWCHRCQRAEIKGVGRATDSEFCLWDLGEMEGRFSTNCRHWHASVRWQTSPWPPLHLVTARESYLKHDKSGPRFFTPIAVFSTTSNAFRHFYRSLYQNEVSSPMPFSSG